MIAELLGPTIDIHAGGLDLIFPHHENEIAQSCCYHDQNMANYWLHNGFINFEGEKMSKSLGNITIMNDLLTLHNPISLKYAILTTHYRQPIDFSNDLLKYSSNIVSKWRDFIKKSTNNHLDQDFLKALEDDLNTPQALMRLQQIFNDLNYLETRPTADNKKLVRVHKNIYDACSESHAIAILTEWDMFKSLDWNRIFKSMHKPAFIFDGRNILNSKDLNEIGFIYRGIGKQ